MTPTIPPMVDRRDGAVCDMRSSIISRKDRSNVKTFDRGDNIVGDSVVNARDQSSLGPTLTHSNYSRYVANLNSRDTSPSSHARRHMVRMSHEVGLISIRCISTNCTAHSILERCRLKCRSFRNLPHPPQRSISSRNLSQACTSRPSSTLLALLLPPALLSFRL